ncbi:hypothetical protein AK830_g4260 [Neonectria ditissima]|uniref:Aminoglycoside phosphotransferase domain-containing protein n=1 Tax=Neonectria ditissima TaxID=78410 RepID=A0A0P7B6T9_9HYPO|nr:hypothetical protein AK830_g4260 [Neonectria ditissima]
MVRSGEHPVVLTHSNLNEMNILVDPPFGFALYALDNALGSRFALAQWVSRTLCWSTPHGLLATDQDQYNAAEKFDWPFTSIDEDGHRGQDDGDYPPFPLATEEVDERVQEFLASIDKGAVCRLASQHSNHKPYSITSQAYGSFNIGFFTYFFDSTPWVIRIPLESVIEDYWTKVQGEVATLRYVKLKKTIPVPRVHAYGQSTQLTRAGSATTAFTVSDFIPGQKLHLDDIKNATDERRTRFFDQLIEFLVELRQLEFPAASSSVPNPDGDESNPIADGFLSMASNELQSKSCHTLFRVYRTFLGQSDREDVVDLFLNHHVRAKELASVVEHRAEASKRHTTYLEGRGLLTIDEVAEQKEAEFVAILKEGIEKTEAIRRSLESCL